MTDLTPTDEQQDVRERLAGTIGAAILKHWPDADQECHAQDDIECEGFDDCVWDVADAVLDSCAEMEREAHPLAAVSAAAPDERALRAEAVREVARWIERLHPRGLTDRATILADLDIWADRMERGLRANGNPYEPAALAARPAPTHECEQEYGTDRDGCVVGPLPCRHPEHTRPAPVVSGADVDGLSVAIRTWHDATFPGKTNTAVALKMAEEAGEVAGAQTRCDEIADGHRTGEPTAAREHLAKELGDLAIVWLTLCARHDLAPETVVRDRWATIQNRRWTTAEPDAATPVGTKRPDARAGFEEMWDGDRWVPICLDCGDEAAYCDGTRHRTVTDTPALEVPYPKCGGLNGSHGTVYVGRGHIAPCPAADDEGGRE